MNLAENANLPAPDSRWRYPVRRAGRWTFKNMGHFTVCLPVVLRITPEGRSRRLTDDTDLVVEGLPRSGNTFAAFAFQVASGDRLTIASRVHVPAQVALAVRRSLPTVITIREPVEASVSHMAAVPHLTATRALREYVEYYERILDFRDAVVFADFAETTTDFGPVVERVNQRFDLHIPAFVHNQENVAAVFAAIDAHWEAVHAGRGRDEWIPRPTEGKSERKLQLRQQIEDPALDRLVAGARQVYDQLIEVARSPKK